MTDKELLDEYEKYVIKSGKRLYPLPFIIWYKQVFLKENKNETVHYLESNRTHYI